MDNRETQDETRMQRPSVVGQGPLNILLLLKQSGTLEKFVKVNFSECCTLKSCDSSRNIFSGENGWISAKVADFLWPLTCTAPTPLPHFKCVA